MRINTKLGAAAVTTAALVGAVPALAHPSHPAQSHKCHSHNSAYIESGTVDATTALTQNTDGTWAGTLAVDVTRTNHAARADKGKTVSYTVTAQKVRFDGGTSSFTSTTPERVKLIGKIATFAKKCPPPTTAPTPVFRIVVVHPAAS